MSFIPKFIMPYEDELLYSWVYRLAKENELSLSRLLEFYANSRVKGEARYDLRRFFIQICNLSRQPLSTKDLFLKHTPFNLEKFLIFEAQQIYQIQSYFYPEYSLNGVPHSFVSEIKYCPECMKEDKEPYLHLSHNITGVEVCLKHKCALKRFNGIRGHEFDFDKYQDIENPVKMESALAYAHYVNVLNTSTMRSGLKTTCKAVLNEVVNKKYSNSLMVRYKQFADDVENWEYKDLFKENATDIFRRTMSSKPSGPLQNLIPLLMILCPDPYELLKILHNDTHAVQEYKCRECGAPYIATPLTKEYGWSCPVCMSKMQPTEQLAYMVTTMTDGEYELVGDFTGMGTKVQVKHNKCGKIYKVNPRAFLFDGRRCMCGQIITDDELKQQIEQDGDFEFIKSRRNNKSLFVTVKHVVCGKEHEYSADHFLSNPRCKTCHSSEGVCMTPTLFAAKVKSLVGDEYTIVKGFVDQQTKVVLRHNVCGKEQEYSPRAFLSGYRCSHCSTPLSALEIAFLLQEYGDGRYAIVSKDKGYYTIQDNKTNKTIRLHRMRIRQEVMRPTPSKLLPIDNFTESRVHIKDWETAYKYLLDYKKEFGGVEVLCETEYNGYRLGDWCNAQRVLYKKGKLSQEKVELLKKVGFIFDKVQHEWDKKFNLYKRYVKQNNTTLISPTKSDDGDMLASWITHLRRLYKQGKLSQDKIDKLLSVNPHIFYGIEQRSSEE